MSLDPEGRARTGGSSRAWGRPLVALVAAITAVSTLAMLINDIVRTAYLYRGGYTLEVGLGSPMGVPADIPRESASSTAQYWTVLISSTEQLAAPTALQVTALWITTLTFVVGAVVVLLLCRRLWTGRTFARSTAVGVLALAGLALTASWLAPALRHLADTVALEQLGYATSGGDLWVNPPRFDLGDVEGPLLVLGLVVLLAGLVYLGAQRLQRDSDGLV